MISHLLCCCFLYEACYHSETNYCSSQHSIRLLRNYSRTIHLTARVIGLCYWRNYWWSKNFQLWIRYLIIAYYYWLFIEGSHKLIQANHFEYLIVMNFLVMVFLYLIKFLNLSLFDLIIINERLSLKLLKYYLYLLHFFKFKHAYYKYY